MKTWSRFQDSTWWENHPDLLTFSKNSGPVINSLDMRTVLG